MEGMESTVGTFKGVINPAKKGTGGGAGRGKNRDWRKSCKETGPWRTSRIHQAGDGGGICSWKAKRII